MCWQTRKQRPEERKKNMIRTWYIINFCIFGDVKKRVRGTGVVDNNHYVTALFGDEKKTT